MAASGVAVRNLDLIYGIPGQTTKTWQISLEQAVVHGPEEIYLYPLYVRPLTGLQRARREPGDNRSDLYRQGRDWLLAHGYRQVSMRLFRSVRLESVEEPTYVCQEDGMLGLGPGARSYTRALHYSSDYAVGRASIVQIVKDFIARDADYLSRAHYGVTLDEEDQRRRYLIKSLLRADGLDRAAYEERFGADCFVHWPQLHELVEHGMVVVDGAAVVPTLEGLAWSDAIGPWLYSEDMRHRMAEFDWE
jgi:oxygen-independent coproporphyrinogen-3 oxidase